MDHEIEKPYVSSGHAFVVFDSMESLNKCINYYNNNMSNALSLAYLSMQDRIK